MALCTRVLRAVYVYWNGNGWNVNANPTDNPNDWNADNRVFSGNCYFSLTLLCESFCFQPLLPPTNNSTKLMKMLREGRVLICIE